MLSNRRTAYDFLVDILIACREPITTTDLFHHVMTQYAVLNRWLNTAIHFKLVEPIGNNKYHATEKGKSFLKIWDEVQTFLKEES